MSQVIEVWANTGEVIERDRNEAEQVQYETDQAATAEAQAAAQAAAEAAAIVAAAAIAQAKSLGFTDEMIAVMYPALITP
jgi:hypothetical protein